MKHLVFLLLVFVSMSVSAQEDWKNNFEENLKSAMSKGREYGKPYACYIKPLLKKENYEAYRAQCDYLLEEYYRRSKIHYVEFMPENEYGQYLYEYIVSAGWFEKNDIPFSSLTKHGKACVRKPKYDAFLIRDVKWSGEIKDGKIQGKGVGLVEFEFEDYYHLKTWIVFEGEFDKGFPIKYKSYYHLGKLSPFPGGGDYILTRLELNFNVISIENDYAVYIDKEDASLYIIESNGSSHSGKYHVNLLDKNSALVDNAVEWLENKAAQGDISAINTLGYTNFLGKGMTVDQTKGAQLFQQAAEKGYVPAMVNYGWALDSGMGVQQNYSKAAEWYKKALDKDPNNSNAKKFLAAVQQKMDDERQKIADEKAKPDKDAKLIQEMFQEAKSYNISGDASKFDLRDKFLNEFISTCSKNPKYDKYKVLAKAKKLSSFCRVVKALYHWSDAPTNWYYEEKMLGLVKYPVWNERPTQMVIEAIDGALAICQKMTKDPDFGSFFTKSIPLLKEKRIKVNNNLSKERREYNAVVAENDARWESRNHEVDTDRHKSPSGELEFHTLLPADGYHYENDGELRSKSGSDYCTYNIHFDHNKKIDYYYIKSCSSKVRDYLKGKTEFKTGSELTSAFMNAIR